MNYLWENIFRKKPTGNLIFETIQNNILFQDLNARDLKFLCTIVHHRKYHSGEPIFKQGEVGVGMYIIARGRVEIFVADPSGANGETREIFITQLTPGDFFGELALVEDGGRRTASAVAREESELIGFFKTDLNEILQRQPHIGIRVLFRLAEVLGIRLKETTEKVSDLRRALTDLRAPPPFEEAHESAAHQRPTP